MEGKYIKIITNRTISIFLLFLLISILIYPTCNCSTDQNIIYVGDDGTSQYSSIQEAIDSANEGEIIFVHEGVYQENIRINKEITLIGEDKNSTIIDGDNDELNLIIHISSDNVSITGFTIKNSRISYYSSGIVINNSDNTCIYNNIITECKHGIIIWNNSNNNSIYHNIFLNNTYHANDSGNNFWNLTYPRGGNYWKGYTSEDIYSGAYQNITGSDGIYDEKCQIPDSSYDYYPYVYENGWFNNPPVADANGPYINYVKKTITFDGAKSYDLDGSIDYYWDFGDGNSDFGKYVNHTYNTSGPYVVKLTITDEFGLSDINTTYAHIWNDDEGTCIFYSRDDTYINQKSPDSNYGTYQYMSIRNEYGNSTNDWNCDSLLRFDLSSIPQDMIINYAHLYLYYYDYDKTNPEGRILSTHKISSDWDENTVNWSNKPDNYSVTSSQSIIPFNFDWIYWDITSDVQEFVNLESNNYGWLISDDDNWSEIDIPIIKFKTKETQTKYQPYLIINYTIPLTIFTEGPYFGFCEEPLNFEGKYIGKEYLPLKWKWDFGDGTSSNKKNPSHVYEKYGTYELSLTLKDSKGSKASYKTSVVIENNTKNLPEIKIKYPTNGIYFNNKKIISLDRILAIGKIKIDIKILNNKGYDIDKVDFYIGSKLVNQDISYPYSWIWDKPKLGRNKITIKAYLNIGQYISDEITIWKVF